MTKRTTNPWLEDENDSDGTSALYERAEKIVKSMKPEELPVQAFIQAYVNARKLDRNAAAVRELAQRFNWLIAVLAFIGTPLALAVLNTVAQNLLWR